MEIKGILYWSEVTDLVRFFIVSVITAHLYSKVVQESHEAAPGSTKTAEKSVGNEQERARRLKTAMCLRQGHGNHGLGSPLPLYLLAAASKATGDQGGPASACPLFPKLSPRALWQTPLIWT